jgi:hypothetical protein
MAATTPKKKKFTRKSAKQYQLVTFTSELFEDEFVFPDQKHFDVDTIEALNAGNVGHIKKWLAGAGVDEDAVEAFGSLDTDEFKDFIQAWGQASKVPAPKSQG